MLTIRKGGRKPTFFERRVNTASLVIGALEAMNRPNTTKSEKATLWTTLLFAICLTIQINDAHPRKTSIANEKVPPMPLAQAPL